MTKHNFTLIIPSLDPDEKLAFTVTSAIAAGIDDIILVDDGSAREMRHYFTELEKAHPEVTLLTHERNLGKGAALKTAFSFFLENRLGRDGVVTADGDGQHRIEDIMACAREMTRGEKAVILGCRDFELENVPPKSRFGNKATSLVFRLFFGMRLSDTQTGLRAIPTEYIKTLMEADGARYEYETNMLLLMGQRHIPYREIKIETVYYDDNKATHFRPIRDSLRVYGLILKYVANSLASAGVDLLMFFLLGQFVFTDGDRLAVLLTTVGARVVSSMVNFLINRRFVFSNRSGMRKTFVRYVCLAVPVMLASWLTVYGLSKLAGAGVGHLGRTILKIPVDTVLFLISFRAQRNWVFAEQTVRPESEKRRGTSVARIIGRIFLIFFTMIFVTAFSVVALLFTLLRGPSPTVRDQVVLSAMQASATKWLPGLFLDDALVEEIVNRSADVQEEIIPMGALGSRTDDSKDPAGAEDLGDSSEEIPFDEWADAIDGMLYKTYSGSSFKAYILIVKDPSRVYVGTSSDYKSGKIGARIFDIVEREGAVAAINAGEFSDIGGQGTGDTPIGLTYSKGKCVWNDGLKRTFMGFDEENVLHVFESMTQAGADELGIRDAVSFQTGNVLITNDGESVTLHHAEGNIGMAQRTAIGQRVDGAVILVVTDGRSASSFGATRDDIIDLLYSEGAVVAGMLDGGSSSMMYYEDYYTKYGIDIEGLDEYQRQGLTNRYKAFTKPRHLPTFFLVAPES